MFNKKKGENKMATIKQLANKLVSEFIGNDDLDFRSEISNHKIMYDKNTFKVIDNFGQNNFENLVIKMLEERA
jgi:uncharacterized protein (UPF0371 family)